MSEFKQTKPKKSKTINIVLLAVFSFLLVCAIAGGVSQLLRGESDLAEYTVNIILIPISAFFVIRSILALKGKNKAWISFIYSLLIFPQLKEPYFRGVKAYG